MIAIVTFNKLYTVYFDISSFSLEVKHSDDVFQRFPEAAIQPLPIWLS